MKAYIRVKSFKVTQSKNKEFYKNRTVLETMIETLENFQVLAVQVFSTH